LKILIVHNAYQQPGGEDVAFSQEQQMLERAGQQVVVYRRSNWEVEAYRGIRRISLAKRTIWASDTRQEFAQLLSREKPDVVHVHNTFVMISPSIYSACYEAGVPVVQTLHNFRLFCPVATFFRDGHLCQECVEHSLARSVEYACYNGSHSATAVVALMLLYHRRRDTWNREISCFVALSEFARSKFVEGGLPAERIFVKPNFVYPDPQARTGQGDYAVYVGRLSPEKRVATLVQAWKRLHFDIPLRIIGDGPDREKLEEQAAKDRLTSVHFEGRLPREETLAAINNSRFLVFPSDLCESFPVTLAESFACGVPVICSGIGSMKEIVDHGRTGLHFATGDPEDLARKVEWAWTHLSEIQEMGKESRKEYEAKYTAQKNYPILMNIYERTIASKKKPEPADTLKEHADPVLPK
jgi:glycosyltransferase involved in cell wall biosynthesis